MHNNKKQHLFEGKKPKRASVSFAVTLLDLHAHTFRIKLSITNPKSNQIITLPDWIVGSYMIRDFAKHVYHLRAQQSKQETKITQLNKSSWKIHSVQGKKLNIEYEVYAHDPSVRGSWLDTERCFFNGTSLFFQCQGLSNAEHIVQILSTVSSNRDIAYTKDWRVFTSLRAKLVDPKGFGKYLANSYEELADSPVLISNAWVGEFYEHDVLHRFAVTGAFPSFDSKKLLDATKKICKTIIEFWHPNTEPIIDEYLFILNCTQEGYGGLEHRSSTALQCKRTDLPNIHKSNPTDGYTTLLGLISHEYFHTWNVKRLRPIEFKNYDLNRENYTNLLWFFEGFTSYYDDLLLRRSGLITDQQYLKLLNKSIQQLKQTAGKKVQSVAQASFDAWIKYYKPDENTPNITVSYYTKGALIALCFDLSLRQYNTSLDHVMRALLQTHPEGPIREEDIKKILAQLSGKKWDKEFNEWIHGVADLPLEMLLERFGVKVSRSPDQLEQQLGLRVDESKSSVHIKLVLSNSVAEQAGFVAGDEWLGVDTTRDNKFVTARQLNNSKNPSIHSSKLKTWRISKINDLIEILGNSNYFYALISRDARLIWLRVDFDISSVALDLSNATLTIFDQEKLNQWLG